MRRIIKLLIRFYQLAFSPFVGQHCRFYPSCSEYAMEAVDRHGSIKGSWLAARRLCKCHPWHVGGLDPVPEITSKTRFRSEPVLESKTEIKEK